MASKKTDKEKKKLIADYVSCGNYSEVARINNCSVDTVRRTVKSDKDFVRKSQQKKEENNNDILKYIDSQYAKKRDIIDLCYRALEEKLSDADMFTNVKDIATVYGIILDKDIKVKELRVRTQELEKQKKDIEDLTTLADMLGFKK